MNWNQFKTLEASQQKAMDPWLTEADRRSIASKGSGR